CIFVSFSKLLATTVHSLIDKDDMYSLNYIYTALSKPVELPGIHEFTAMGLMNNKQIDYYDSVSKKKIPKQDWMKDKLDHICNLSYLSMYIVIIYLLFHLFFLSDVHILQWKHGCEIDQQPDGTLKFIKGIDQYSYDGDDFLAFDDATMQWVAPVDQALPTKRKWDGECVDWLSKFMEYGEKEFSRTAGHVRLTCMVTGFYPKDVLMHIKKNGVPLTKHDGVQSAGVLPNDDETYQIRMSVQIPEADKETYECYVDHRTLKEPIVEKWGKVWFIWFMKLLFCDGQTIFTQLTKGCIL
uniref:Ig-like domain-containing protein n=1 Tax=Hucho hucho TaxID=62062 RepID=A0A4W5Q4A7_9TELE